MHRLRPEPADELLRRARSVRLGHRRHAEQKQDHVVEFVSKQLAGKNAEFAGDALAGTPRKFGLVYIDRAGRSSAELADRLRRPDGGRRAPLAETIPYALDPATIQQTALQIITRLKAAGVTTVIFSGDPVAPRDFTREATAQDYFPEWVLAARHARRHDGVRPHVRPGAVAARVRRHPAQRAHAARGQRLLALYEWFNGTTPPADDSVGVDQPHARAVRTRSPRAPGRT